MRTISTEGYKQQCVDLRTRFHNIATKQERKEFLVEELEKRKIYLRKPRLTEDLKNPKYNWVRVGSWLHGGWFQAMFCTKTGGLRSLTEGEFYEGRNCVD